HGRSVLLIGPVFDVDRARRCRDTSGVEAYEIPIGRRDRKKSYARRATALLRVWLGVLRTNARAYHAHDIHVGPPAWVASRLRGAKLIYDGHELWHAFPFQEGVRGQITAQVASLIERLMVRASDAVITTNQSRADELSKRYGRTDITVLANVPLLEPSVQPDGGGYPAGKR